MYSTVRNKIYQHDQFNFCRCQWPIVALFKAAGWVVLIYIQIGLDHLFIYCTVIFTVTFSA